MIIHSEAAKQYFTDELFIFQFYPVFNFKKIVSFRLGTLGSKRVNPLVEIPYSCSHAFHSAMVDRIT